MNRQPRDRFGRRRPSRSWWPAILVVALLLHVVGLAVLHVVAPYLVPEVERRAPTLRVVRIEPPPEREAEPEEEPEPEVDLRGQIVDVAPPERPERPKEADYLAEHDQVVEEETRSERFEVTPEVIARTWSKESRMETEDLIDLNIDKPSTGAEVGNHRFDPDRHGTMAALPSRWTLTNKPGPQDPVPAQHRDAAMSGAPSNDLLDEKVGDATNLNTKEFLYAGYLNRIRRLVNFYWQQNLDNLPSSVALPKPSYTTDVHTILDSRGQLEHIEIVSGSGSAPLDEAVVQAFRLAGPFPNPPEGLIEKDGRVYLPEMGFTVQVGVARVQYQGIDPRAGVQYPGILKSPR